MPNLFYIHSKYNIISFLDKKRRCKNKYSFGKLGQRRDQSFLILTKEQTKQFPSKYVQASFQKILNRKNKCRQFFFKNFPISKTKTDSDQKVSLTRRPRYPDRDLPNRRRVCRNDRNTCKAVRPRQLSPSIEVTDRN
jgi:hypothetical protein